MTGEDTPLSKEDVFGILAAVGDRAVLVGGQAVAWWAEYYASRSRLSSVQQPTDLYVSKDADFMPGSLEHDDVHSLVADVATQLQGRGSSKAPFQSLLVGSVEYQDSLGCGRAVEFLKNLYGIKNRQKILDGAVPFNVTTRLTHC